MCTEMKNDTDLQTLVSLLSYLKKHEEFEKREKPLSFTDETQRKLHERLGPPNKPIYPEDLSRARYRTTSVGSGTPGSTTSGNIPDVSDETSEGTEDSEGIIKPYKHYHSHGTETGPREGKFDTVGDTPVESVTAPDPSGAAPDFITDEEDAILQWFQDENWSLSDIKQLLEDCTAPSARINKSNEYPLLKLFKRLGI